MKNVRELISEELIPEGNYSNTSLRKCLSDRLSKAGVPDVLVDAANGHFNTKKGTAKAGFASAGCPNQDFYVSLWKESITRKKIAFLLSFPFLCWNQIQEDDEFHIVFKKLCPNPIQRSIALPQNQDMKLSAHEGLFSPSSNGDSDSAIDENILNLASDSELSTPEQPSRRHSPITIEPIDKKLANFAPSTAAYSSSRKLPADGNSTSTFQLAQHNSAVQYAVRNVQSGGVVNINFITNNHYH